MKKLVIDTKVKLLNDELEDLLNVEQNIVEVDGFSVQEIVIPANTSDQNIYKPIASNLGYTEAKILIIQSDINITVTVTSQGNPSVNQDITDLRIIGKIAEYGGITVSNNNDKDAKITVIMGV